jgi:hypothetical protein
VVYKMEGDKMVASSISLARKRKGAGKKEEEKK